jgi:hypothetical protein
MKAAVYHRYGPPDVVQIADAPALDPAGEVAWRRAPRDVGGGHKKGNVLISLEDVNAK